MNYINDTQDIINKGRKNTLKDTDEVQVTVPLRDQIPNKLLKKLKDDQTGIHIREMWRTHNADRREWFERQKEYLDSWDEFLTSTDSGPFEGSSTLHLPITLTVAKTLHARFLQALLGIEPPFQIKPRVPSYQDRATVVQDVMGYCLKDWANNYQGVTEAIDAWVWDWVTTGSGVLKIRWERRFEKFVDVRTTFDVEGANLSVDENGNEITVPNIVSKEEEFENVVKCFEGPCFEVVNPEDIAIIKGAGNPQNADGVIHRYWMTASELWQLVDQKIFDAAAVKEIIKSGENMIEGAENSDIKQRRAYNAGQERIDTNVDLQRFEILECYLRKDVDGSGINSEIVVWAHEQTAELLRATYLRRINVTGERPYFKVDYHKRRDQEWGIGLVEMMYPLSTEMDALHNMRIDFGLLSTMPFGFYRPTSSIDPQTIALEPGALIPVDNPQTDIFFPNLGNRTSFGFQEEAALFSMVERLTSISDINLGVLTSQQGAARTATGARAILGESSANLDVHLRRLNHGWKLALKYLMDMLQQRIPDGLSFRITRDMGSDVWYEDLSREEIAGDYDIEVDSNSSSSNQQVRIANADAAAQILINPIDIQLGNIGPEQIFELRKQQLQARGIKDAARYMRQPQQQRIFTPREEVERVLSGREVPVNLNSDHEGVIAYIDQLLSNNQVSAQLAPEEAQALAALQQQHAQVLQALQDLQRQQANIAQQQQNVRQSADQAPTGGMAPQI